MENLDIINSFAEKVRHDKSTFLKIYVNLTQGNDGEYIWIIY